MKVAQIVYFDAPGPANTDGVIAVVKQRAAELGIRHVVVASHSGKTAMKMRAALTDSGLALVCVSGHAGSRQGDEMWLADEARQALEGQGVKVFVGAHALSGVGRAISRKFGGISHTEIIAYTLRQFGGEGIKVAVEVAVMAADAGLIPTSREVIAVGGTSTGADTAVVLVAAHMNNYFDLEIREILAKPRQRSQGSEE